MFVVLLGELINLELVNIEEIIFKVCIFDQLDCCKEVVYIQLNCQGDVCLIGDVIVDFVFCDEEGFYVKLDFVLGNQLENGFYKIFGNGEIYDIFSYGDECLVVVGLFDLFMDNIYELIVEDLSGEGCSGFMEFVVFDCLLFISGCFLFEVYVFFELFVGEGEDFIGVEFWGQLIYMILENNEEGVVCIEEVGVYLGFDVVEGKVVFFSEVILGIVLELVVFNVFF